MSASWASAFLGTFSLCCGASRLSTTTHSNVSWCHSATRTHRYPSTSAPLSETVRDRSRDASQVRHGAVLGVAELVAALGAADHRLGVDKREAVAAVVPAVERAGLYRGKGGELMRCAVARRATPGVKWDSFCTRVE